jgi:hypothetical protein
MVLISTEHGMFLEQVSEWLSYNAKMFDKLSVVPSQP